MSENYGVKQTGSGGMAGSAQTPANSGVGHDKPKAFDAEGSIGKQFTGNSHSAATFSFFIKTITLTFNIWQKMEL